MRLKGGGTMDGTAKKRPYTAPRLRELGDVRTVVLSGAGKVSGDMDGGSSEFCPTGQFDPVSMTCGGTGGGAG